MKSSLHRSLHILLADDDKDDRFFFEKALNELSLTTRLKNISNGEQLLDYLSQHSEQLPDVLFLDLNMPRKNGLECLREIKADKKLKRLPVIIYSTSLREEVTDMLYQYGAHYYLHKCDFTELTTGIQKILDLLAENPDQPSRDKFVLSLQEV